MRLRVNVVTKLIQMVEAIDRESILRKIYIRSEVIRSGRLIQAIPQLSPGSLPVQIRHVRAPHPRHEAIQDDVSETSGAGRGCTVSDVGTGAQRHHHIRPDDRGPDVAALPQSKIDRIVVLETAVLKGTQRRNLAGLEESDTRQQMKTLQGGPVS